MGCLVTGGRMTVGAVLVTSMFVLALVPVLPQTAEAKATVVGVSVFDDRTGCAIRLNHWDVPDAGLTSGAAILYTECITVVASANVDACLPEGEQTYRCTYHFEFDAVGRGIFLWHASWYTWGNTNFVCTWLESGDYGNGRPGWFHETCLPQEAVVTVDDDEAVACTEFAYTGGWTASAGGEFGSTRFEIGAIDVMVRPKICAINQERLT